MEKTVRLHSIQTFGTMDGPGIRTVLFFQGCPFRCAYCHNPDAWSFHDGNDMSLSSLFAMMEEYRSYYGKDGGVTVSGGECLFQADFLVDFLKECKKKGIHTVVDTSGMTRPGTNEKAIFPTTFSDAGTHVESCKKRLVFQEADLVLLDLKFTTEEKYHAYTAGSLAEVLETLSLLQQIKKPVWIRQVIIPGINDSLDEMIQLKKILMPFPCIEKVDLLPFRKLCLEKYKQQNLEFPFRDIPEMSSGELVRLQEFYDTLL